MPANKNELLRYHTLDGCLRNRYRRYTLEDLVEACSDALAEAEGYLPRRVTTHRPERPPDDALRQTWL